MMNERYDMLCMLRIETNSTRTALLLCHFDVQDQQRRNNRTAAIVVITCIVSSTIKYPAAPFIFYLSGYI